jgi:hypothetical protein
VKTYKKLIHRLHFLVYISFSSAGKITIKAFYCISYLPEYWGLSPMIMPSFFCTKKIEYYVLDSTIHFMVLKAIGT